MILLLVSTLVLTACGGGGGGGSSEPATSGDSGGGAGAGGGTDSGSGDGGTDGGGSGTDNPGIGVDADNTTDLVVDADFTIQSTWKMVVDFDAPGVMGDTFLSVCSDYSSTPTGYDINFDSCVVRSAISNGVFDGEVTVTNDIERLIGAMYYYDETTPPEYREFTLTNGQELIDWN